MYILWSGTDLRKTTHLQFAVLLAAFTISAAYVAITEKTMSATSPEEAAEVAVTSSLSSDFVTSALPVPHESSSHLRKEETSSSNAFDGERDRLEAAFDAVVEEQVRMAALVDQEARTNALSNNRRERKTQFRIIPLIRCLSGGNSHISLIMFFPKFRLTRSQPILF